jgi:hypothetical protein
MKEKWDLLEDREGMAGWHPHKHRDKEVIGLSQLGGTLRQHEPPCSIVSTGARSLGGQRLGTK